jgi:hypothetical protein
MCMRYINPNSRRGIVNKLADYILNQIDKSQKTRLQVTDFKTFYVVNGNTNSDKVLDLSIIKESFYNENKEILTSLGIKQINIIDIIEYKEPVNQLDYCFDFYNSDRPLYHQSTINELRNGLDKQYNQNHLNSINYSDRVEIEFSYPYNYANLNTFNYTEFMSVSSEFPYGYSLNMGRLELYYSEYICNHLFTPLITNKIEFTLTKQKDSEDDLIISINSKSIYNKDQIKSLVLDTFDFNFGKFQSDFLDNYDLTKEIDFQLSSKPWMVKDKTKDMVLF